MNEPTRPLHATEVEVSPISSTLSHDGESPVPASSRSVESPPPVANASASEWRPDQRGASLRGRIIGVEDDTVFVDVGSQARVRVPRKQFNNGHEATVGKDVDLVVVRIDTEKNELHANLRCAVEEKNPSPFAVGSMVDCQVTGMIKGGLEAQIGEARAFMPASHVDITHLRDISVLLGQTVRCQVLEVDKKSKNIIVSRRKAIEQELAQAKERLLSDIQAGQVRKGVVRNIVEYGAFVDVGGVHGLLHVSDMSWAPVEKPADVVKEGDQIEVKVLKVNLERNRISLGLKQMSPDPWKGVESKYSVGMPLNVRVVKLAEFGAFAEVEKGVNGLIPLNEMSWAQRPAKVDDVVQVGQSIDVAVLNVDGKRRRIGLSIRQLLTDPWAEVAAKFPAESIVTGQVTRCLDFGALVELQPGIEGMVHVSEMSQQHVKSPADVVSVGEEVKVKVLAVDAQKRRIALSIKATQSNGQMAAESAPSSEKPAASKKRKKPLRGGLSSHFEW